MATSKSQIQPMSWPRAVERLFELERHGELKPAKARRLAGFVCQLSQNVPMETRTEQRGKRELRDLGIAVTDQHLDAAPVNLSAVVGATIASSEWR